MTVLPIFMKTGNTVPTKIVSNREKGAWYNIYTRSLSPTNPPKFGCLRPLHHPNTAIGK
jgi:hypothetical protein